MKRILSTLLAIALIAVMVPSVFASNDTALELSFDKTEYELAVGSSIEVQVLLSKADGTAVTTGITEAVVNIPAGLKAEVQAGLITLANTARPGGNVKFIHDVVINPSKDAALLTLVITADETAVEGESYDLTFSDLAIVDGDYLEYVNIETVGATVTYVDPDKAEVARIKADLEEEMAKLDGVITGSNSKLPVMEGVTWAIDPASDDVTVDAAGNITRTSEEGEPFTGITFVATITYGTASDTAIFEDFTVERLALNQEILDGKVEDVTAALEDFAGIEQPGIEDFKALKAAYDALKAATDAAEAMGGFDVEAAKAVLAEIEAQLDVVVPFVIEIAGDGTYASPFTYTVTDNADYVELYGAAYSDDYYVAVQMYEGKAISGLFVEQNEAQRSFVLNAAKKAQVMVIGTIEQAPKALADSVTVEVQ